MTSTVTVTHTRSSGRLHDASANVHVLALLAALASLTATALYYYSDTTPSPLMMAANASASVSASASANANVSAVGVSVSVELPVIPLAEVRRQRQRLWVIHDGIVYDVTTFIDKHPGGREAILTAVGEDVSWFWRYYRIHYNSDVIGDHIKHLAIGRITEEDKQELERQYSETFPPVRSVRHAQTRAFFVRVRLAVLVLFLPFVSLTRAAAYLLNWISPSLVTLFDKLLPFTLLSAPAPRAPAPLSESKAPQPLRVAVIGGGIAGMGCAYALSTQATDTAPTQVTVYESRAVLGGNAQTHTFTADVNDKDGGSKKQVQVLNDLLVMFFSPDYYKNYMALLRQLQIEPYTQYLPYLLRVNYAGKPEYYTPPGSPLHSLMSSLGHFPSDSSLASRFSSDFSKYDRLVSRVRSVNDFLAGDAEPSFYKAVTVASIFNPFNYMSLRTVVTKIGGCSEEFFNEVVEPFHSLSLYYNPSCGELPSAALPILDDINPLTHCKMACTFGEGGSAAVFRRLASYCHEVKLNTRVRQVRRNRRHSQSDSVTVVDDKGNEKEYDYVVFACPPTTAANILQEQSWCEDAILNAVSYDDDVTRPSTCFSLLEAPIHSDINVLPTDIVSDNHSSSSASTSSSKAELSRSLVTSWCPFLIDADTRSSIPGVAKHIEYHHVLGAWPAVIKAGLQGAPFFISFNMHEKTNAKALPDPALIHGHASPPKQHPSMSTSNIIITQLLHLVQGRHRVYYCGAWTAPGNGHDLALTSGLAIATAIKGEQAYPFNEQQDQKAKNDWRKMRKFMSV